jgi:D-alanine--poly(phosphoribitol) ligase subunit 1
VNAYESEPSTRLANSLLAIASDCSRRVAVSLPEGDLTYGDVLRRAADYQRLAVELGMDSVSRLLFCGSASLDFYGVLFAGLSGAFVPAFLNEGTALQVIEGAIEAVEPEIMICASNTEAPSIGRKARLVLPPSSGGSSTLSVVGRGSAYLSQTSGTLGAPSVALVDGVALQQFLVWGREMLELSKEDVWLEGADSTADLAMTNALLVFSAGGRLVLASGRRRIHLARLALETGVTVTRLVPATARMMLIDAQRHPVHLPTLRVLAFGGDALPSQLARDLMTATNSSPRTLNTYGKTEAAGFLAFNWFDADHEAEVRSRKTVPVVECPPGTEMRLEPKSGGDARSDSHRGDGELVVESVAVALEVTTAGRTDVLKATAGDAAILRTGDLMTQHQDGLTFVGRLDRQVKVNGVTTNLDQLQTAVAETVGGPCFVGYVDEQVVLVVEGKGDVPSVEALSRLLAGVVPSSLMPRRVSSVSVLPRNRSGKIDVASCVRDLRDRGASDGQQ